MRQLKGSNEEVLNVLRDKSGSVIEGDAENKLLKDLNSLFENINEYAGLQKFKDFFKQKIGSSETEYLVSKRLISFEDGDFNFYAENFNRLETSILNIIEESNVDPRKKEQITQLYKISFSEFYKTIEASSKKQDELRDLRKELKPLTKSQYLEIMKGENEIVPEKDENKYFYSYIDESGKIEIMLFEKVLNVLIMMVCLIHTKIL